MCCCHHLKGTEWCPGWQVLITRHDKLSPGVAEVVQAYLGGKAFYTPASGALPQSVQTAVEQGFRFPVRPHAAAPQSVSSDVSERVCGAASQAEHR